MSNKKNKLLNIAITDLAPLCQMDHYNNFAKVLCKYWKILNPDHYSIYYKECYNSGNYVANDSNKQKILMLNNKLTNGQININDEIYKINKIKNNSQELVNKQAKLIDKIDNLIPQTLLDSSKEASKNKDELMQLIKSSTNVVYGTKNEYYGFDYFKYKTNINIKKKQEYVKSQFTEFKINEDINIKVYLVGYIDGITELNDLIEVKNRRSKLFNTVRDYEMCQIQSYLHLIKNKSSYQNVKQCYLVEIMNKKKGEINGNIINIEYDNQYFDNIIKNNLYLALQFIISLMYDHDINFTKEEKHNICSELIKGDPNKFVYNLIYS